MAASSKTKKGHSHKAGLELNVARVRKSLRRAKVSDAVGSKAPFFVTGAMEAICKHILTKAFENSNDTKSRVVSNTDVIAAVRQDPGLSRLFGGFAFSSVQPAKKAIDYILPAKEQKVRQDTIEENKKKAAERLALERQKRAAKKAEEAKAKEAAAAAGGGLDV